MRPTTAKVIIAVIILLVMALFGYRYYVDNIFPYDQAPIVRDIVLFYRENARFSNEQEERTMCSVDKKDKDNLATRSDIKQLKIKKTKSNNSKKGKSVGQILSRYIPIGTSMADALLELHHHGFELKKLPRMTYFYCNDRFINNT